jgi:hypothetical protein
MTRTVMFLLLLPQILIACAPVTEELTGARMVGTEQALALPEPGTQVIVGVVQTRYTNALEQEIVFATNASTPGQNALRVTFLGLGRAKGDDVLVPTEMTDETIAAEISTALPGVAMRVSPAYVQNAYGPFGYAIGMGRGRDLCLFGWQRIEGEATTPFVRQGAIDLRLRLCRPGASERALVAAMYGYTVRAPFGRGWATGAPTPVTNAAIGLVGVPIAPVLPEPASRTVRPAPSPAPAPAAPAQAPMTAASVSAAVPGPLAPEPIVTGPVVPGPPAPGPVVPAPVVPAPGPASVPTSGDSDLTGSVPIVPPPPIPVVLPDSATGPSR